MDKNLVSLTTLNNHHHSMTPLVTGGKGQQLISGQVGAETGSGANGDYNLVADNSKVSQGRIDGISTIVENESNDNISQTGLSNYEQTSTIFGSPGMNKSIDKLGASGKMANLRSSTAAGQRNQTQQNNNQMYQSFGNQSQASNSTAMPQGNSAQRQNISMQHTFGSPEKSNAKSGARRGSQARSGKSNSSRDSNEGARNSSARRNNLRKSASRRGSFSTDQDSTERSFIYPGQAFKQFLIAVKEGKIDLKDLNNSPFLIDYLTMQAQIGGGSGGATGSLRQSSKGGADQNRSGSNKGRDHSKSNKKNRASLLGDSSLLKAPRDSIIEEDEDEHNTGTHHTQLGQSKPATKLQHPSQQSNLRNLSPEKTSSPTKNSYKIGNPTSKTSNMMPNAQNSVNNGQGPNSQAQSSLQKQNFKEDINNNRKSNDSNNQSRGGKGGQESAQKKQRRGRNDRSTSGDERSSVVGLDKNNNNNLRGSIINLMDVGDDDSEDVRFDEKGRPIKYSSTKPKTNKNNQHSENDDEKNTQGGDYNSLNDSYNKGNNKSGQKNRRGRRDRDSSVNSSVEGAPIISSASALRDQSPNQNEPRPLHNLPKPAQKDEIQRQSQNILPYQKNQTDLPLIEERANNYDEDGTFRDYEQPNNSKQNSSRYEGSSQYEEDRTGRIPIFNKNTDFKIEADYSLNAFKDNQEQQPKKYLKSNVSPLKKQQFKEDDEIKPLTSTNKNNHTKNDDDLQDDNQEEVKSISNIVDKSNINAYSLKNAQMLESRPDDYQSSDLQSNHENPLDEQNIDNGLNNNSSYVPEHPSNISATIYKNKTPSRESRKVKSSMSIPGMVTAQSVQESTVMGGAGAETLMYREGSQTYVGGPGDPVRFKEFLDSQNRYNNLESQLGGVGQGDHGDEFSDRDRSKNFNNDLNNRDLTNKSRASNNQSVKSMMKSKDSAGAGRNDSPMKREDLDQYNIAEGDSNDANNLKNQSSEKKQRRGRANRGSNQSSVESSLDRQPLSKGLVENSRNPQVNQAQSMKLARSNHPDTIEEQLSSHRSKASSKLINQYNQDQALSNRSKIPGGDRTDKSKHSKYAQEYDDPYQENQDDEEEKKSYSKSQRDKTGTHKSRGGADDRDDDKFDKQSSNRYQDDYNNQLNSSRLNQSERKREHRRGQNSNDYDSSSQLRESQKSLHNLADHQEDPDAYNYNSFGQQQVQQPNSLNNNQRSNKNRDSELDNNLNYDSRDGLNDYNSSGSKRQRRGRNSRSNSKNRKSKNSDSGEKQNSQNREEDKQREEKKQNKYQSKLRQLEEKLKRQVQDNPSKPLDYKLIQDINEEAARTIQMHFKQNRKSPIKPDEIHRHGNLVDRPVQTDPVSLISLAMRGSLNGKGGPTPDMDRFKKFFFAVFYTYMMMNTIMADVFKRQQPIQSQGQWNQMDYTIYMQQMQQQRQQQQETQQQQQQNQNTRESRSQQK